MKKLCCFFILFSYFAYSQTPDIEWQKAYGGNDIDYGSVLQTKDGGYLLFGSSLSNISFEKSENNRGAFSDYWIIKITSTGTIEWQRTIGSNDNDFILKTFETRDGGFLIFGITSADSVSGEKTVSGMGYWTLKLDAFGAIVWQKVYNSSSIQTPAFLDRVLFYTIIETQDNGFMLGGMMSDEPCYYPEVIPDRPAVSKNITSANDECSGLNILLLKVDENGDYMWEKVIRGNDTDELKTIEQTPDGGYIIGAISNSVASFDKTESPIIVVDPTDADLNTYNTDYWIIKTDAVGEIEWQNTIGTNAVDYLKVIKALPNGYEVIGNASNGISGDKTFVNTHLGYDLWRIKLDLNGNIISQNELPIGSDVNVVYADIKIMDNDELYLSKFESNYLIVSSGEVPFYDRSLVKVDESNNVIWSKTINTINGDTGIEGFTKTNDGGLIVSYSSDAPVGGEKTEFCRGMSDFWVVKFEPESLATQKNIFSSTVAVFPNPTKDLVTIQFDKNQQKGSVILLNLLGQVIESKSIAAVSETILSLANVANGVYFVKIKNEDGKEKTVKIIKE